MELKMKDLMINCGRGILGLIFFIATGANAATQSGYVGKVTDIWFGEGTYGNCIVKVDGFSSPTNDCPADWVSLGCDGAYHEVSMANKFLESAEISLVMKNVLYATVDDARKYNGYCTAKSVMLTSCINRIGECEGY
jgi:hypothetical protein